MKLNYRQVIQGVNLTDKELKTLEDAERIIQEVDKLLCETDDDMDDGLHSLVQETAMQLRRCIQTLVRS